MLNSVVEALTDSFVTDIVPSLVAVLIVPVGIIFFKMALTHNEQEINKAKWGLIIMFVCGFVLLKLDSIWDAVTKLINNIQVG